ncbi:MAG: transposase [Candidatus Uhrbacteria bacterium]|nr:transposase [Candidatus Uhrbacteria bacterium]
MFLFNDEHYSNPGGRTDVPWNDILLASNEVLGCFRSPYVKIISFILMPNHIHLALMQISEDGISKFMHKLLMGHARYFNLRHKRVGRLYQGIFEAILQEEEAQAYHLPRYIHLNALDLTDFNWRDGKVDKWEDAMTYLNNYKWSSHSVYMSREQELPVVDIEFILENFPLQSDYISYLMEWSSRKWTSLRDVQDDK